MKHLTLPLKPKFIPILLISSAVALTGCGGDTVGTVEPNTTPVADAGADQKGTLNSVIILDGSGSRDTDGDTISYDWTLTSAPTGSVSTLSDADTDNPTLIPDVGGLYVASLVVNDGKVDSTSDSITITSGFLFPEYDPLGVFTNCTTTFERTFGINTPNQYTNTTVGLETVNYISGSLTGTVTNDGGGELASFTTYNDGTSFKLLRADIIEDGNVYFSTDCAMAAHPEGYSFDIVYDGLILDQTPYFVDVNDPLNCTGPDTQKNLFTIQDITIQGVLYQDAIISWVIDLNYPFKTVSNLRLDSLGIISPTSEQTGSDSLTDIQIYANGTGMVASGDIDAETGALLGFVERTAGSCR